MGGYGGMSVYYNSHSTVPVKSEEKRVADNFFVYPNYPNPFNPSTQISFQLETSYFVKIEIHNLYGQKVRTLVNDRTPAGFHVVKFDGRDENGNTLSSGIYFYTIKAGPFRQSKKFTLLR